MKRRGEEGFLTPVEWLLIAAGMAAAGAMLGTLINIATSDDYGVSGPKPLQPIALAEIVAPPTNDCGRRVLDLFKGDVNWTATDGWQSTEMRKPVPPIRPADTERRYAELLKDYNREVLAYNGEAAKWNTLIRLRVASVQKELREQECDKVPTPLENTKPSASVAPTPLLVAGTYSISWSGLNCSFPNWEQETNAASVGGESPSISFGFTGGGGAGQHTMREVGQNSFEVSDEAATIHVRFGVFGDKIQVDGSYTYNGPEAQCTGLFSGLKN